MNEVEFNRLRHITAHQNCIGINDLKDRTARTLLYGYNKDYSHSHTYIEWQGNDPVICTITYRGGFLWGDVNVESNDQYLPDKRLLPHACDREWCELLVRAGVHLPFTTPDWGLNDGRAYYGKRIMELVRC